MAVQIVRPAGAGHETLAVLGASLLIVVAAASYIGWGVVEEAAPALSASQLDARVDLTPAEQGIYADLRIAFEELAYAAQAGEQQPDAAALAELGLPPFVQDPSSATRGGHLWSDGQVAGRTAYLGQTRNADVAGSFLMLGPGAPAAAGSEPHAHDHSSAKADAHAEPHRAEPKASEAPQAEIWLSRSSQSSMPSRLDADTLAAAGWRQVMAQFDAGVTRQSRP